MDVDAVFADIGELGPFQLKVYSALAALHTWAACHMFHIVYVGATPAFSCNHGNNGCPPDGAACLAPDFSKGQFSSIVSEWSLVCSEGYKSSLVQSIFMAGVLLGAFILGNVSDKHGRKHPLFVCIAGLTVFGFLSSFATGYALYCVLRFTAGILCGGMILVSFVLATEVVGSTKRALCGMIIPGVFALGIALFSLTAYLITNWRLLSVVTSLPGAFCLIYFWFVPESPRWLLAQGRVSDAEKVLADIAHRNLGSQYSKVIRLRPLNTSAPDNKSGYGLRDILGRPSLRWLSAVQIYAWFVNSGVYYGLTMSAGDLGSNMYMSVALSGLVELPAYVLAFTLLDRLGRRPTFCFSMLIGGSSCMAILLTPPEATTTITALALLGKLAISASFAVAYIYSAEIYPTVIRNNAMGVCSMAARVGGIVSPMIIPMNSIYPNLQFLVFGGLAVTAGILSFKLPETLNRRMPETLEDLEGDPTGGQHQVALLEEDKVRLLEGDILDKQKLQEEGEIV